jgi:predicted ribosomally synthesized peptide with SipW-like signal peptide
MTALTNVARMPGRLSRQQRLAMAALAILAAVSVGAGATSLAIFTDSAESTGTFTSGTIDITSSPTVAFTVAAMMPGDDNTQALTIANAGTGALRYSLVTVASNILGDELTLTVKTFGTDCSAFDGTTVLAATTLDGAAIGSPTQGADAGDRVLGAASSEVLCFRVSLPLATGNAAQGISSAVTFTFDAEQTANN